MMKIHVMVFTIMTQCSDVVGYQAPCSMTLWKSGILPHHYTISQPRRPWCEHSC